MPRPRPPHLHRQITRHGKVVWYVRVARGKRIRLRAALGTEEFAAEYAAATKGETIKKGAPRSGSLAWLIERYRETTAWASLSVATRRQRDNIFLGVLRTAAASPFAQVARGDIESGKDRRLSTPAQARNFLDAMRGLFRWALTAQLVRVDPTQGIVNPKRKTTEGFKAWTEGDVARYEACWPAGTRQRVWLHVLLYIGCRRGDAVTLGRQHVKDGVISFVTEKGREKDRIEVTRRVEPELVAALSDGPCGDLIFICGERGRPFVKESFGNAFKDACTAAGIMDKSAHGLRKLSATIWAERGATEHELMAMFGWLTPQMAALYTRKASRKRMALGAHDRLLGTQEQRSIPSPDAKVRDTSQK